MLLPLTLLMATTAFTIFRALSHPADGGILVRSRAVARVLVPDTPDLPCTAELLPSEGLKGFVGRRWAVECKAADPSPVVHLTWNADTGELLLASLVLVSLGDQSGEHLERTAATLDQHTASQIAREVFIGVLEVLIGDDLGQWKPVVTLAQPKNGVFQYQKGMRKAIVKLNPRTGHLRQLKFQFVPP